MKLIVYIVGLRAEVAREVEQDGTILEKGDKLIAHYARKNANGNGLIVYDDRDSDQILLHFRKLLAEDGQNTYGDHGVVALYVKGDPRSSAEFVSRLYPGILAFDFSWQEVNFSGTTRRQSISVLLALLKRTISNARVAVERVAHETLQKTNTTPLLLPCKNFYSTIVANEIRRLHCVLPSAQDHEALIRESIEAIKRSHPARSEQGQARWFRDDRDLDFRPPGTADMRHGFANDTHGHPASCFVAGRRRLGAPYHRGFHYDCSKERTPFELDLHHCHDAAVERKKFNRYVNIAPNDHFRGGK